MLEERAARVQIVDVRERDEFDGPLGRIRGATLIPLARACRRARRAVARPADRHGVPLRRALGAGRRAAAEGRASTTSPTSPAACCAGAPKAIRSKARRGRGRRAPARPQQFDVRATRSASEQGSTARSWQRPDSGYWVDVNVPGTGYESHVSASGTLPIGGFAKSQTPLGKTLLTVASCAEVSGGL